MDKIVKHIIDFLRGKTIIHRISCVFEACLPDSRVVKLKQVQGIAIEQKGNTLDLKFASSFLTYVQWPYYSAVEQIQKINGGIKTLDIYAHHIFKNKKNSFVLRFNDSGIVFKNRRNIEDTLFLDLQRYCEHNRIYYEVK